MCHQQGKKSFKNPLVLEPSRSAHAQNFSMETQNRSMTFVRSDFVSEFSFTFYLRLLRGPENASQMRHGMRQSEAKRTDTLKMLLLTDEDKDTKVRPRREIQTWDFFTCALRI